MNELTVTDSGFNYSDNWDLLLKVAENVINAGLTSNGNPKQVAFIIMKGRSMGLGLFESLENVFIINNRASISTDLAVRLVEKSGLLKDKNTVYEGEGETRKCIVTVLRHDRSPATWSFSIAEARQARLFERRTSPWATYPDSMLYARAMGFAMKREFSDVLGGNINVVGTEETEPQEEKIAIAHEVVNISEPVAPKRNRKPKEVQTELPMEGNGHQSDVTVTPPEPEQQTVPEPAVTSTEVAQSSPSEPPTQDNPPFVPEEDKEMSNHSTETKPVSENLKALRVLATENAMTDEDLMRVISTLKLSPETSLAKVDDRKIKNMVANFRVVLQQHQRLMKTK
jgi:hypothetical protein